MALFDIFRRNNPQQTIEDRSFSGADGVLNGLFSNDGAVTGISAVFAAVELISNSIAELPIVVKKDNTVDKSHPINNVFSNGLITKFELIKKLVEDAITKNGGGFAYIKRVNGMPVELVYLEGGSVNIQYNNNSQELYYTCSQIKGKILPENIIHIYKNSNDGVNGRPISSYAKKVFDLCKYTDSSASSYYQSGCNVSGILTVQGNPSQEEVEKIRMNWKKLHGSKGESGLAILRGNMTYQSVGTDAASSQMLEARLFNVSEVARFFNINPVLLGDNSKSSYNTLEAAQNEFVSRTLLPYITLIEEEFTRKLFPNHRNSGYRIDLDESYIIRMDKSAQASYLTQLVNAGIMSTNEARLKLGLSPVEGGDKLIIPYTKVEDNTIGETVKEG